VFTEHKCYLQWLGILGSVSSIVANLLYGALYNGRSSLMALAFNSVLAGVFGLSALPFARMYVVADLHRCR
jgi:hypothetical protein